MSCPDCPSGTACDPCEPTSISVCEIVVAACSADADCADGLICVHFSGETCAGSSPACDPGSGPCDPPPPPECTTVDEAQCAPPWIAACTVDADCGPGFTCETAEACTCVVYPDPADGTPPPPEECTCAATSDTYCALQIINCVSSADCPEGLICTDGSSPAAPCFVDAQGNTDCPSIVPATICAPPGYVTPLPLDDTGGVAAERADAAEGEGEGEPDDDDNGSCSSAGAPALPVVLLFALLPLRRRRQR